MTQHTGTDMNVTVNPGTALIPTGTYPTSYDRMVAIDTGGGETVAITTAPTSNSRIDAIVGYIDTSVTPSVSPLNNANLIFKLADVNGTVAASPSPPSAAQIQAAIGASNPYTIFAYVTVGTNVTQIVNSNITDMRGFATPTIQSGLTGWTPANETHTFASSTTVTVPSNATTKYDIGDFYMMSQSGTTKVFIITGVTSTVLTVTGLSGATVVSATISQPYFSKGRNPHGALNGAPPYNPYKFYCYRSTAWTMTGGADFKIPYNTKYYDSGSNYDNTTNFRFTAPVAGFWAFTASWNATIPASSNIYIMLWKNGAQVAIDDQLLTAASSAGNTCSITRTLQLAAGDYIEVYGHESGVSAAGTADDRTSFSGCLVSVT